MVDWSVSLSLSLSLHVAYLGVSSIRTRPLLLSSIVERSGIEDNEEAIAFRRGEESMANGYYYQNSPYYYNSSHSQSPPLPLHLCLFLLTLFMFIGLSWYMAYESVFESLFDQLKFLLMMSPLVLLLVVHWLSSDERLRVPFFIPLPERDSFHRAGGSPWGVALVLVLLMFMISYQSYFHDCWFPLLSR